MYQIVPPQTPFVYICGAGPGDVGLLTLKTYHLITQIADVVIYDRLIPDAILALIPSHVEKIYAGKAAKCHHLTQDEINTLLVTKAQEHKIVVRLKGGDPFIFGRGGEEMFYLMEHGINFEIVPGITAADGCSAYAGIPLTHRGIASHVTFVTGHQQKDQAVNLNYPSLIAKDQTLVIYMGLARLQEITNQLIKHGLDPKTPAMAIMEGTTPRQRTCYASVADIYQKVTDENFQSPTIIIIGHVVGLKTH